MPQFTSSCNNSYSMPNATKYYCTLYTCARSNTCKNYKEQTSTDIHWYGSLLYTDLCPIKRKS